MSGVKAAKLLWLMTELGYPPFKPEMVEFLGEVNETGAGDDGG